MPGISRWDLTWSLKGKSIYTKYHSLLPFTYHLLLQGHTCNRLGNAALILPHSEMNYATAYSFQGGLSLTLASPSATCFGPIRLSITRPSVRLIVRQSVLTRNICDCSSIRLLICSLIRTSKTKEGALTPQPERPQMTIWRIRIVCGYPRLQTHIRNI